MTPEEIAKRDADEEEKRRLARGGAPATVPPPPTAGTSYGVGNHGPANVGTVPFVPPPPQQRVAGVDYDPATGPTGAAPPPMTSSAGPVQPYTSDSNADQPRAAVDPARAGGGLAGTPWDESIPTPPPPPPPPPVTVTGGELPTVSRTTVPPPVVAGRTTTAGVSGQSQWTDSQREAAAAIRNAMAGQGPSAAELQGRAAADRAAAEQLSMAAGARGRNVAAANRIAAANIAQIHQQAAGQAAELRAREQAQARGELAQLGTAARGQDLQAETSNAELTLKAALASDDRAYGASVENAKNALAAVGLDDKYTNEWLGRWLEMRQQNQTEKLAIMERDLRVWLANHPQAKDFWDKLGAIGGFLGGLGQGVTAAAKAV
jgi:hypothetical protein